MTQLNEMLHETIQFIHSKGIKEIDFGMILGSGLGELGEEIDEAVIISYNEIPYFPTSTVLGHAGKLVYGYLAGKKVLAMQGRFHFYEGHAMQTVTYPVRVIAELKAHSIIITNACGGVNESFEQGDLMLITDHINFTGQNPLIGPNKEIGPRFQDMSEAYALDYREVAKRAAYKLGLDLKEGVYMGYSGPTYETPAEIRMSRIIGADAVGMSTVPEVIVAAHSGLKVLGISCITNMAAGMQANLKHEEVLETTQSMKQSFKALIKETLKLL